MYNQMSTNPDNIRLFMSMRGLPKPRTLADVPTYVLVPAFVLNEMTIAFKIGILLFIPFIIIDMVVASILMSMGMIMLPPVMISMPFKIILFVLVDGWNLLTLQLAGPFTKESDNECRRSRIDHEGRDHRDAHTLGPRSHRRDGHRPRDFHSAGTTQIQEQTLTFVPKIAAIMLVLAFLGSWMFGSLSQYTRELFAMIPQMAR